MTRLTPDNPSEPIPDIKGPVVNMEDFKRHREVRKGVETMMDGVKADSIAMEVALDLFDIVLEEEYAPADSVAFYLLAESASFLRNAVGVDREALLTVIDSN